MRAEIAQQIIAMIEAEAEFNPTSFEFEVAYQARVAMDRIRFAIRATESAHGQPEQLREVTLQLLDALDRLESAERSFQRRFRSRPANGISESKRRSGNDSGAQVNRGA
jgi:hypothetical protein